MVFSELFLLCTIAIIKPPEFDATAIEEKTFFNLQQNKTYLRNKIINEKLSDIASFNQKSITKNLDIEKVVKKFSENNAFLKTLSYLNFTLNIIFYF